MLAPHPVMAIRVNAASAPWAAFALLASACTPPALKPAPHYVLGAPYQVGSVWLYPRMSPAVALGAFISGIIVIELASPYEDSLLESMSATRQAMITAQHTVVYTHEAHSFIFGNGEQEPLRQYLNEISPLTIINQEGSPLIPPNGAQAIAVQYAREYLRK